MDLTTAFEILGLPPSATLDEVKARYHQLAKQVHPDTSPTQDGRPFILLTTAYSLIEEALRAESKQQSSDLAVSDEIITASAIKDRIGTRFERLQRDYQAFRDQVVGTTKAYIHDQIYSASSGSGLKERVKNQIPKAWVEMVAQLEGHVSRLCEKAVTADTDFLYALFSDLYTARRRYWLSTLYQNPTILLFMMFFTGSLFVPSSPQLPYAPWLPQWCHLYAARPISPSNCGS